MARPFVYGRILEFKVVDGDTIKSTIDLGYHIRFEVVCRLNGIDAPEKKTRAGGLLKQYICDWLTHYQDRIYWDSHEVDKFGRSLGTIHLLTTPQELNPSSLNERLLEFKLVRHYAGEKRAAWSKTELKGIESVIEKLMYDANYGDPDE